jgi:type II secretory pathway pseudopilin PulG
MLMLRRRLHPVRDERGMTLVELLVAISAGMVIFFGLTMMVIASMHQTTRITNRVHATADARLATERVVNELQSACAARYLTPVRKGSTGTVLKFARAFGSAVSPSPVMTEVKLVGSSLWSYEYPVSGGSTPEWTFNETTPTSQRILISNVAPISASVPIFSYYQFTNATISTQMTPPAAGFEETEAEKVVKVGISFKVTPPGGPVTDANGAALIQDSALLRFTPPTYVTTSVNGPCE